MFGYLYIAEELERNDSFRLVPTDFCKIGITTQRSPSERLRKLQVGNPRKIHMPYMWVGMTERISSLEQRVKDRYYSNRRLEWIYKPSSEVKDYVQSLVDAAGDIYLIPNRLLPYTASSYGHCSFNNKDSTGIFFEAKELAKKYKLNGHLAQ